MVKIELKEIVSNHDNRRKALNAVERGNKKTNPQYPYYGANGIVDFIDEYIFDEELLCIAEDGGNWGYKQNCSYIVNGKYWVNNHVHVLKPKKNVEIKYLMYYLNYTDLTSYITGTTRGKLTRTALDKIQINLPELEIQREIVIILDKINNLIEKNKKRIIYLEELVKARFIEMFGDPIKNDKGWEKEKLLENVVEKVENISKNSEIKFTFSKLIPSFFIFFEVTKGIPISIYLGLSCVPSLTSDTSYNFFTSQPFSFLIGSPNISINRDLKFSNYPIYFRCEFFTLL